MKSYIFNLRVARIVNIVYFLNMIYVAVETPTAPRTKRHQETSERILAAARKEVVASGFSGLSIHKIAKATNYTPGALYRYYPSKDALVSALAIQIIGEFAAAIASIIGATEGGPRDKIRAALFGYRGLARKSPEEFGLLSSLLADSRQLISDQLAVPAINALIAALIPLQDLFRSAFPALAADPKMCAAQATIAFATIHGILQLRKQVTRSTELGELDALITMAIDSLLSGFDVNFGGSHEINFVPR